MKCEKTQEKNEGEIYILKQRTEGKAEGEREDATDSWVRVVSSTLACRIRRESVVDGSITRLRTWGGRGGGTRRGDASGVLP